MLQRAGKQYPNKRAHRRHKRSPNNLCEITRVQVILGHEHGNENGREPGECLRRDGYTIGNWYKSYSVLNQRIYFYCYIR